jgi:SAM-dependent methyltransferase
VTASCLDLLTRYPSSYVTAMAADDPMYTGAPADDLDRAYRAHGRVMLDCIRMAMIAAQKESVNSILDLPSGHGRVLRLLKAEYPEARLAAGDIRADAVEFCATTFGATPVYCKEDPKEIRIDDQYDLIWCGSLLTHFDVPRWVEFMDLFESALAPGGLLVISVSGRCIAELLRDRDAAITWSPPFGDETGDERREAMLRSYDETGFGYDEYPSGPEERAERSEPASYGLSVVKPSWFCGLIEARPQLQLVTYAEGRWGLQDIVSCVRVESLAQESNPFRAPFGGYD